MPGWINADRVGADGIQIVHDIRDGLPGRVGAFDYAVAVHAVLVGTVERLLTLPEPAAVIVVDNGSRDGTASALAARCPDTAVIRLGGTRGAAGRNVGVDRAAMEYVALSDDDTWWAPGALTRAVEILDAHPRLAVLTAHVVVGPDERDDGACLEMAASPLPRVPDAPGVTPWPECRGCSGGDAPSRPTSRPGSRCSMRATHHWNRPCDVPRRHSGRGGHRRASDRDHQDGPGVGAVKQAAQKIA